MMRLGSTPYVNALPLTRGLADQPGVELIQACPARLAELLRRDQLDAALVSSSEYFTGRYELIGGAAISAAHPGADAVLFSNVELHLLRSVALDSASLSTNLLLRLLLHWLNPGAAVRFESRPPDALRSLAEFDACLLIGDVALEYHEAATHRYDLARLWFDHTSLPLVLTVWLAQPGKARAIKPLVLQAAERGRRELAQIAAEASEKLHWDPQFTQRYLNEVLDYSWSASHEQGLMAFGAFLQELGLIQADGWQIASGASR